MLLLQRLLFQFSGRRRLLLFNDVLLTQEIQNEIVLLSGLWPVETGGAERAEALPSPPDFLQNSIFMNLKISVKVKNSAKLQN